MARPRLGESERRRRTIGVRVTEAEAAELRERAQAARLSMGTYLRRRALGQRVRSAVERRLGDAGAEPDRGKSESNGAGAQLESRVVAGRDPGGGRARQRSPLRSCLVRDVREWAERIGRKHER